MKPVTRTASGLVNAVFDSIDALNEKRIDPEHARAISHSAKTIVSIAALELEYRRVSADRTDTRLIALEIEREPAAADA